MRSPEKPKPLSGKSNSNVQFLPANRRKQQENGDAYFSTSDPEEGRAAWVEAILNRPWVAIIAGFVVTLSAWFVIIFLAVKNEPEMVPVESAFELKLGR